MKLKSIRLWCFCAWLLFNTLQSVAQDTVRITMPQAEKIFAEKNLLLLAGKYNISIANAQLMQAKLYNNPNVAISANLYNPVDNKLLDVSNRTGQYSIDIQKVIRIAGKRNKEIKLAETSVLLSENNFFDLLRTLRYSLRSNFYSGYYLQNSIQSYTQQIALLQKISAAYDDLKSKGIVSLRDAVRIKSLLYALQAEQVSLQNQLQDIQSELQTLLHSSNVQYVFVKPSEDEFSVSVKQLTMQALLDTAYANRYDLKLARNSIVYSEQNLALQKAMAKPDITLGGQFDKRGSFVDNASFITASIDLPFFNRNQGNIKAAKLAVEQTKIAASQQQSMLEAEVQKAYMKLLNSNKMIQSIDVFFNNEFEKLMRGVADNFQKKNISLIEFTDFIESYKNNVLQLNQLLNERAQAAESLNYATGKTILNK